MTDQTPLPGEGAALLTLVQWLSPAFPIGAYAYSHGLESVIAAEEVRDAGALRQWLADVLEFGAGRTDAILLAHSLRGGADHQSLAALARAMAPTAERLQETEELGAALTRATDALLGLTSPPLPFPIALGRAAQSLPLTAAQVIALALQAFAAGLVSAAVRFVPLGQTEGQAVLTALHPLILRLAAEAAAAPLAAIGTAAIRADMASARHETLNTRIFRT